VNDGGRYHVVQLNRPVVSSLPPFALSATPPSPRQGETKTKVEKFTVFFSQDSELLAKALDTVTRAEAKLCRKCGSSTHRESECPQSRSSSSTAGSKKCRICDARDHDTDEHECPICCAPTHRARDCRMATLFPLLHSPIRLPSLRTFASLQRLSGPDVYNMYYEELLELEARVECQDRSHQ